MSDAQRIELLEKALIKYVEMYGFNKEARDYYILSGIADLPPPRPVNHIFPKP